MGGSYIRKGTVGGVMTTDGPVALITGVTGQDGAYLAELLLDKGYEVHGGYRRSSTPNLWRLDELGITDDVELVPLDVLDQGNVLRVIQDVEPTEVYNLAAQSFVATSFEQPVLTADVTGVGVARVLESLRIADLDARFYQASSSEMFGDVVESPQTESTPLNPRSPYAAAKVLGHHLTVNYREAYGMHASSGILFNHESPLRGIEFVTRKVSHGAARIHLGLQDELGLGNMEARRDWGYAPEFVEAMWRMLQQTDPGDYVVATGESHSVRDLCEAAFDAVGLDHEDHVVTDERFLRPSDVEVLKGDPTRAREALGWEPETSFRDLVRIMVEADVQRLKDA